MLRLGQRRDRHRGRSRGRAEGNRGSELVVGGAQQEGGLPRLLRRELGLEGEAEELVICTTAWISAQHEEDQNDETRGAPAMRDALVGWRLGKDMDETETVDTPKRAAHSAASGGARLQRCMGHVAWSLGHPREGMTSGHATPTPLLTKFSVRIGRFSGISGVKPSGGKDPHS